MKLQLLINNVFIIFDNCAFKCQNSEKPRLVDTVISDKCRSQVDTSNITAHCALEVDVLYLKCALQIVKQ